jgi:hypothetical protein
MLVGWERGRGGEGGEEESSGMMGTWMRCEWGGGGGGKGRREFWNDGDVDEMWGGVGDGSGGKKRVLE